MITQFIYYFICIYQLMYLYYIYIYDSCVLVWDHIELLDMEQFNHNLVAAITKSLSFGAFWSDSSLKTCRMENKYFIIHTHYYIIYIFNSYALLAYSTQRKSWMFLFLKKNGMFNIYLKKKTNDIIKQLERLKTNLLNTLQSVFVR